MKKEKKDKHRVVSPEQRDAIRKLLFLAAYRELCNVVAASEVTKIPRSQHFTWMDTDQEYKNAFAEAHELARFALLREARRRAIEGIERNVYRKGLPVGTYKEFSDRLLEFLIMIEYPEFFSKKSVNAKHGEDVVYVVGLPASVKSKEEWKETYTPLVS